MTPADIIYQQLGGRRFVAMTGASLFFKAERGLKLGFKIPAAKDRISYVAITLDEARDSYNLEFGRVAAHGFEIFRRFEDVYVDMLHDVFTEATGLRVSL